MRAKLKSMWQELGSSYWFYPGLFAFIGILLGIFSVYLDKQGYGEWLSRFDWYQFSRPSGTSGFLSLIASAMIGVAATVFSITIAAVAYASGNYGPRLLTNFMEDRANQISLATFIGTFVYCLTVLRYVREAGDSGPMDNQIGNIASFSPQLSLFIAQILTILCVGVLIFLLNHIPSSIRINSVLEGIGRRLLRDIQQQFDRPSSGGPEIKSHEGISVKGINTGYVQAIDFSQLWNIAKEENGKLLVHVRTGDFVQPNSTLVYWSDDCEPGDLRRDAINDCFALGGMRTPNQDLHFLIDELVEIGLRALSPGINDPFTAITALHWLGAATAELGWRDLSRNFERNEEEDGIDRLILLNDDFAHFVSRGFGSMRSGVASNPAAARVMFEVLLECCATLNDDSRIRTLARQGELLMEQAREHLTGPDLYDVEARFHSSAKAFEAKYS